MAAGLQLEESFVLAFVALLSIDHIHSSANYSQLKLLAQTIRFKTNF